MIPVPIFLRDMSPIEMLLLRVSFLYAFYINIRVFSLLNGNLLTDNFPKCLIS